MDREEQGRLGVVGVELLVVAQLGITNMSSALQSKRVPSMIVAPRPSNARYTELPV